MNRVALFLVFLLLSAGCARYPSLQRHEVDYTGAIERTENGFRMNGTVEIIGGTATDRNFSSVSVTLYNSERVAYRSFDLGRFSTNPSWGLVRKQINLSASTQPKYVVIESPGFWGETDILTMGFVWNKKKGYYTTYTVQERSDRFNV